MAGLEKYIAKTDDRPWCNPATWIHQDRWNDQPAQVQKTPMDAQKQRSDDALEQLRAFNRSRDTGGGKASGVLSEDHGGRPQIFITGLVELIENYPDWLIARIASPVNGLPAKFKFCPLIAEIKEACEEWMVEKGREEDLKRRFSTPKLANYRPRENRKGDALVGSLCARFGIPAIPPGWDAVTVTQQAHLHGADFPRVVQRLLANGAGVDRPLSPAQMVVEKARIAMERRLGEAAEYRARHC
jgi:hypothetical protein